MRKGLLLSGVLAVGFLASCGGGGGGDGGDDVSRGGLGYSTVSGSVSSGQVSGMSLGALATGSPQYVVATTRINGQTVSGGAVVDGNGNFTLRLIRGKEYTFALYDSNGNLIGTLTFRGNRSVKVNGDANVFVDPSSYTINSSDPDLQPGTGISTPPAQLHDSDGDGTPDEIEDNDFDRIPDNLDDYDCNGIPEELEHKDRDHDSIPDHIDNDDDDDGVYDLHDPDDDDEYEYGRCEAQAGGTTGGNQGGNQGNQGGGQQGGGNQGGNQGGGTGGGAQVSFQNDVLPILNASCAGCHGGAGNFHLSSATDKWAEVTKFVNTVNPANSRLLLKATGAISHGGGQVISPNSQAYITILRWIQSGAPNN